MNTNINMTNQEYSDFVDTKAEKSTIGKNLFFAFVIGGLICVLGQIIKNISMYYGIKMVIVFSYTTFPAILVRY